MAPQKNKSGFVLPQIVDPPRKCVKIWIPNEVYHRGAFWGAIFELCQAYNWQQNPPEKAREVANLWFDIWSEATRENNDMTCCDDVQVLKRINPVTGNVEQSSNGGATWTPEAGNLQSVIVTPVPPVTSGVAATKCDAATNVSGQVQVWIDQVSNDFTTAVSLLEFGLAVIQAILVAVLTILSAGALTPIEAVVLPTIGAALAAAWAAGKAAFDAYWTTDIKDDIFCAAFCNISDDGSYTDAQFSAFWNKCNSDLPASPAKMLFMGFLSSVGRAGLNAMAASGASADGDCSDCHCDDCDNILYAPPGTGAIEYLGDCKYRLTSFADGGQQSVYAWFNNSTGTFDPNACGTINTVVVTTGAIDGQGYNECVTGTLHNPVLSLVGIPMAQAYLYSSAPFVVEITVD